MHLVLACLIFVLALDPAAHAQDLRVAVAANFRDAAKEIAEDFTAESGTKVAVSVGSTGQLAGQILQGAPFDVFLAADRETPARLVERGVVSYAPRAYALGRLVLVRADGAEPRPSDLASAQRIAMANPRTAPYGRAASAYLRQAGLWERLEGNLVFGQSVSASFAAVKSGAAEIGLVALSSVKIHDIAHWPLPTDQYPKIEQAVLQLSDRTEASEFVAFLFTPTSRSTIAKYGYGLP